MLGLLSSARGRRSSIGEEGEADPEAHERLLLLELATDLECWPARNRVVREALDRAAQDLVAMAGKGQPTASAR
jgi:hypothetical protein